MKKTWFDGKFRDLLKTSSFLLFGLMFLRFEPAFNLLFISSTSPKLAKIFSLLLISQAPLIIARVALSQVIFGLLAKTKNQQQRANQVNSVFSISLLIGLLCLLICVFILTYLIRVSGVEYDFHLILTIFVFLISSTLVFINGLYRYALFATIDKKDVVKIDLISAGIGILLRFAIFFIFSNSIYLMLFFVSINCLEQLYTLNFFYRNIKLKLEIRKLNVYLLEIYQLAAPEFLFFFGISIEPIFYSFVMTKFGYNNLVPAFTLSYNLFMFFWSPTIAIMPLAVAEYLKIWRTTNANSWAESKLNLMKISIFYAVIFLFFGTSLIYLFKDRINMNSSIEFSIIINGIIGATFITLASPFFSHLRVFSKIYNTAMIWNFCVYCFGLPFFILSLKFFNEYSYVVGLSILLPKFLIGYLVWIRSKQISNLQSKTERLDVKNIDLVCKIEIKEQKNNNIYFTVLNLGDQGADVGSKLADLNLDNKFITGHLFMDQQVVGHFTGILKRETESSTWINKFKGNRIYNIEFTKDSIMIDWFEILTRQKQKLSI